MALGRGVWGDVQIPAKACVYPLTKTLPQVDALCVFLRSGSACFSWSFSATHCPLSMNLQCLVVVEGVLISAPKLVCPSASSPVALTFMKGNCELVGACGLGFLGLLVHSFIHSFIDEYPMSFLGETVFLKNWGSVPQL